MKVIQGYLFNLDKLFGKKHFSKIYSDSEYEKIGEKLMSLNSKDKGYLGDNRALDKFAMELGFRGWYGWEKV